MRGRDRVHVRVASMVADGTVPWRRLRRVAEATLRAVRAPAGEFSVIFVDGGTMRRLNRRYLGHDYVTDVLSFDLRHRSGRWEQTPVGVLGEVIIAPSMARRQARRFGEPYQRELARYVVHGLLHWAGYDDHTAAQRRRMEARQEALLRRLMPGE